MSFAGAVAAMKQSFDNNRAMLKSHRSVKMNLKNKGLYSKGSRLMLQYKEVNPEDLALIKTKIRLSVEIDSLRLRIASLILAIVIAAWVFFFSFCNLSSLQKQ